MKHHEKFWVIAVVASVLIIISSGIVVMFAVDFDDLDEASGYAYSASRCEKYTKLNVKYEALAETDSKYDQYAKEYSLKVEEYCD